MHIMMNSSMMTSINVADPMRMPKDNLGLYKFLLFFFVAFFLILLTRLIHVNFQEQKTESRLSFFKLWYARHDSNVWPSAPQADALSNWATGTYVDVVVNNIHLEIKWASPQGWHYYYNIFLHFVWLK